MKRKTYSEELNFITLTIVGWIDVFTRRKYNDFIIENLIHCQFYKDLNIYAYVLMTNHLHMVVKSEGMDLPSILRDFKSYTAKQLVKMIQANDQESRKEWMIYKFRGYGAHNSQNKEFQFWQNGNHPTALYSNKVIEQKIDYIHQNPVRAGFCDLSRTLLLQQC